MTMAIVFPGQGSQSLGMLADLAQHHSEVVQTFGKASEILGYDLWDLAQNGPEEMLNQTDKTQPAMLAAGVAVWRVWQALGGGMPAYFAGHSLGEYTALVCSEALAFEDGIALVAERGRLMQAAVPAGEGAMAAILGLDDDKVREICDSAAGQDVVSAVNFNSPGQVVIAGHAAAVERAVAFAKESGAKRALLLSVSVPSHCQLMQAAAEKLAQVLETVSLRPPIIPVVQNADVSIFTQGDDIKAALVRQLHKPVRWVETIQWMSQNGVESILECGPGKVLAGLNKRIDRAMTALPVYDSATMQGALSL